MNLTGNDVKRIGHGLFNIFEDFPGDTEKNKKLFLMADYRVKIPNLGTPLKNGSDIFQNMMINFFQNFISLT